jgi:hypothetical protein
MGKEAVMSREEFDALLKKVQGQLTKIEGESNLLISNCNLAMGVLPLPVALGLRYILSRFGDLVTALFEMVKELMWSPGWPPGLYNTGDDWTNKIGKVAGELITAAGNDQTSVDEKWKGPAQQAYLQALLGQKNALIAVKAACDDIDDALFKIALALAGAWVAIVAGLVMYIVELCAAAAAATTAVAAPPAAAAAGVSTVKVTAIVSAAVTVLVGVGGTIYTQYKDLNQRLQGELFAGGVWPAIADAGMLGDGSMTDGNKNNPGGDGSDWQLNYT